MKNYLEIETTKDKDYLIDLSKQIFKCGNEFMIEHMVSNLTIEDMIFIDLYIQEELI